NRETGALLVAQKYDPAVNWATKVDMKSGRPIVDPHYSPGTTGPDVNVKNICPASLGSKDEQPSSYDRKSGLLFVPTNHVCMNYEPFQVEYTAGQPYVGRRSACSRHRIATGAWATSSRGIRRRARSCGRSPS